MLQMYTILSNRLVLVGTLEGSVEDSRILGEAFKFVPQSSFRNSGLEVSLIRSDGETLYTALFCGPVPSAASRSTTVLNSVGRTKGLYNTRVAPSEVASRR